jgi:hypothetical protein
MNYPDAKHADTFQMGMEFQDFVCIELAREGIILQNLVSKKHQFETGENLQGFEIKLDNRCTETGRLSIEIAEKSRADVNGWTPSGICRKDNTWLYVHGNYDALWVFGVKFLQQFLRDYKPQIHELPTIKKFYLPIPQADKWCCKKLAF